MRLKVQVRLSTVFASYTVICVGTWDPRASPASSLLGSSGSPHRASDISHSFFVLAVRGLARSWSHESERSREKSLSSRLNEQRKPDPIDFNVGRKIRTHRRLLRMSQTELADALGVTYQQVQKYENGRSKISVSRLQAVANVLSLPVLSFFETSPDSADRCDARLETGQSLAEFASGPTGIALNRAFARITDKEVRSAFLGLVNRIAEQEDKREGGRSQQRTNERDA
ncbi:Uncharacterized HTH-type transcriptional regulator Smed_0045 [Sinorhizobium fredii HH103]|uniref:Uncharacterized HTH-type transcriptional regulator Smed_0045 n=1 Tax=Sinorhizobium fredii (strain HH103) TaxID=1117943 RepID=G9A5D9_SINF1|nr:hypothetical protein AB395_00003995 [Sinorhizobium fredii CCBAU 45436]CCE98260.1 Uncharacterized HTH-type transcriptional regulator Smed_0045 [Sinorhizobium fredii HH103]